MAFWERPRALQGPIASKSGHRPPSQPQERRLPPPEGTPRRAESLGSPKLVDPGKATGPSPQGSLALPEAKRPRGGASNIQHHTTSYNIHTTSHTTSYNIGPFDCVLIVSRL